MQLCWLLDRKSLFNRIWRINAKSYPFTHAFMGVRFKVVRESACMACKRSPVRSRYSPPKKALYFVGSMVLFFFAEAGFGGLHCFACTIFRLFAGGSYTTPNFWLYTVFKKECLPPGFSAGCYIIPFNVQRMWASGRIREKRMKVLRTFWSSCVENRCFCLVPLVLAAAKNILTRSWRPCRKICTAATRWSAASCVRERCRCLYASGMICSL